jgi:CTP:molybdopterin cytidylyltransferase MocA
MRRWRRAARPVLVVTGADSDAVQACLAGFDVQFVHNPDHASGMASSLRCGLAALPADADAAVVLLADMPRIDGGHVDRLLAAFDPRQPKIVAPVKGRPARQPDPLAARIFRRDDGGGGRCRRPRGAAAPRVAGRGVAFDDDAIFADVDTPAALDALQLSRMSDTAANLRAQFPLLAAAPQLHYLDSAATAQIHRAALDAVVSHETTRRANVMRGTYRLAEAADLAYERARQSAARFLNAGSAGEIVFTPGATASLNLVAHAFGSTLKAGDRVLVSVAEHHSNFVPWQMLRDRCGIELALIPVGADGRLDLARLPELMGDRCRLVAVTQCSNVTGAWTDVAAIVAAARKVGARVLLDGAQAVQHGPQDVQAQWAWISTPSPATNASAPAASACSGAGRKRWRGCRPSSAAAA